MMKYSRKFPLNYLFCLFYILKPQDATIQSLFYTLKQDKHVKPSSSIAPLSQFINSAGLLCVVGRLKTENIPPNPIHQILISKHHLTAKLLITDIHLNYAHYERDHTLCILQ